MTKCKEEQDETDHKPIRKNACRLQSCSNCQDQSLHSNTCAHIHLPTYMTARTHTHTRMHSRTQTPLGQNNGTNLATCCLVTSASLPLYCCSSRPWPGVLRGNTQAHSEVQQLVVQGGKNIALEALQGKVNKFIVGLCVSCVLAFNRVAIKHHSGSRQKHLHAVQYIISSHYWHHSIR